MDTRFPRRGVPRPRLDGPAATHTPVHRACIDHAALSATKIYLSKMVPGALGGSGPKLCGVIRLPDQQRVCRVRRRPRRGFAGRRVNLQAAVFGSARAMLWPPLRPDVPVSL